jgi:hypothetical protein
MTYTFIDHLHNYSVWTAARAVQRGYTTTKNIKAAIDKTELSNLAKKMNIKTPSEFDNFHRETSKILIEQLANLGIPTSYGRAAKIIGVYLKTSIVIRANGESQLAKIIHPPIDNTLLTNLSKKYKKLGVSKIKWTQLSENEYFELIKKLRSIHFDSFWELEKFWTPIQA